MRGLGIAAAAAIAFAPFSVVASTPAIAQAAPSAAISRIAPAPADDHGFRAADLATSAVPERDLSSAGEEPSPPWWHWGLHYAVLMTVVGLAAWAVGSSSRGRRGAPALAPRPQPRRSNRRALSAESTPALPTRVLPGSDVTSRVLTEAAHRCAVPTCRHPTTEIARIVPLPANGDDWFDNLIAMCPGCQHEHIDRQTIRNYKRNLAILNSRYSDLERRLFDQTADTGKRSFVVQVGLEIALLNAVNDGLLKRVDLSPVPAEHGEPTHHKYEVSSAGMDFVSRYVKGDDISAVPAVSSVERHRWAGA